MQMKRPEYWEDDETWAIYDAWLALQSAPKPEPLSGLKRAIAKARGDILTEEDMRGAIDFQNRLWGAFKAGPDGQGTGSGRCAPDVPSPPQRED
jgi:hypothetical protein